MARVTDLWNDVLPKVFTLDEVLMFGVSSARFEQHFLDTAHQNGIPRDKAQLLWRKLRLGIPVPKLVHGGEVVSDSHRAVLVGLKRLKRLSRPGVPWVIIINPNKLKAFERHLLHKAFKAFTLDELLMLGVSSARFEQRFLDTEYQSGIPRDKAQLRWRKLRLDIFKRRFVREAEVVLDSHRPRLVDLERRLAEAVLDSHRPRLMDLERRLAEAWRAMPERLVARLHKATPQVTFRFELGSADQSLVSHWCHPNRNSDKETCRIESARRGEKAALAYYRSLGQKTEDVSIQQLDPEAGSDWKSHDLRADGRPLDVKNVRCEKSDRFAEHLWKDHKTHRKTEVPIVGAVSMLRSGESIITGEFQDSALTHFHNQIETFPHAPVHIELKIMEDWRRFVPGWLFEYTEPHYASMPDWDDVLRRWLNLSNVFSADVAPWIYGFAAARSPSAQPLPADTEVDASIRRFFNHFDVSRRTIFWFALTHMLSHMKDPWCGEKLIERLFPERTEEFPLGLFDPRKYIWNLILTLKQMIDSNRRVLESASGYRLMGAGILRAWVDGKWLTVLAYCGECGKWPIFLGETVAPDQRGPAESGACKSCPCSNGRLVCDECHSCSGSNCVVTYATPEEAQRAAREYPGWRKSGCTLQPPAQDAVPLDYYCPGT